MKKLIPLLLLLICTTSFISDKKDDIVDWSRININDEYKINIWKAGNFKKMKKGKTFINSFAIEQFTAQKGALSNKQSHSTGLQIKSSAAIQGLDDEVMKKLTDDLYKDFSTNLKNMGVELADGSEVINNSFIQKKATKIKNVYAGSGAIPPVDKKYNGLDNEGVLYISSKTYHPINYDYVIDGRSIGNSLYSFAMKAQTNFVSVLYRVEFAEFDGSVAYGVGTRSANMDTRAQMKIIPNVTVYTTSGTFGTVTYKKPIVGNSNFAKEISKASASSNFDDTSKKVGYYIVVDPNDYGEELKTALLAIQNSIFEGLKEEL